MPYPTLQDTDLILDTETTGLGRSGEDDVLELAIVDGLGQVLFDQRLRPLSKTSWPEAQQIHGIAPEMVKELGTLGDHWPTVRPLLCDPDRRVWVYNKNFDFPMVRAMLNRSSGVAAVAVATAPKATPEPACDRDDRKAIQQAAAQVPAYTPPPVKTKPITERDEAPVLAALTARPNQRGSASLLAGKASLSTDRVKEVLEHLAEAGRVIAPGEGENLWSLA